MAMVTSRSTIKKSQSPHVAATNVEHEHTSQQAASQPSETSPQSPSTDTEDSSNVTTTPISSSESTSQKATPSPTPTSQPFGVSYVTLSQSNLVCSSNGSYIIQIGDVIIGLASSSGGTITYGFEVSGDITDAWGGYHQSGSVAAGTWSTSFNQLYWGSMSDPHMAYTEQIPWGHGAGAVRAVVYTPNAVYSQWFAVPAQAIGQSC